MPSSRADAESLAGLAGGILAAEGPGCAFPMLADDLPVGVHELDRNGIVRAVNRVECEMLGYPREALLGMPVWLLMHPEHREASRRAVFAKMRGEVQLVPFRRHYQHSSGRMVVTEVHEQRLIDEHGVCVGMRTVLINVSDREELSEQLAESEQRFRTIVEQMGEGIAIFDCGETCLFANAASDRIFGVGPGEFVGRSLRDFVDEHDWERIQEQSEMRSSGLTTSYELEIRQPGGAVRTILVTGSPQQDRKGRRIGTFGILRDITERKDNERRLQQNEERFRSLAASVGDALVLTDAARKISFWNRAAEEIFGHTEAEALGRDFLEMTVPERFRRDFGAYYDRFCRAQGRLPDSANVRELLGVHRSGKLIPVELSVSSFLLEDRWMALACIRDISRRKEAEYKLAKTTRQLADALERAEDANRAKGEFLASMSHEIRTPMNGILGMSGLLVDTPLNEEQHFYAGAIRSSATALLDIINDILDFSKIEARQIKLEQTSFDLRTALEDALDLVTPKAGEKRLELALWMEAGVPRQVVGDPGRLRQVVLNLVGNAVKFTDAGHVVLQVRSEGAGSGQRWFRFEVRDTGVGIDPEQLPRLFERFTQADSSATRRHGGTGLGLAIARELTELMGGTIGAESRLGEGSVFHFRLPLVVEEQEQEERRWNGRRAVVVERSEASREVVVGLCRGWGMEVRTAADGQEAMAELERGGAEVLLLDAELPGIQGCGCVERLRGVSGKTDLPVVLLTSAYGLVQRQRLEELGCQAVVLKPFKAHLLEAALAGVLERQEGSGGSVVSAVRPHGLKRRKRKTRALLVEDHHINQKLGVKLLEKLGCKVDVASNGVEAVQLSARLPYDIIFMDCQMPEMDGYEATGRIRQRENGELHTPIVAMTAAAMADDRQRCLDAGMDDYISKPVVAARLEESLERWLKEPAGAGD